MSCRRNAWSPDSAGVPAFFACATAVSNSVVPAGEGAAERLLLGVGDRGDAGEVGGELGVAGAHRVAGHRQQLGQGRLVDAEQLHRPDGAAQQPAQDVAAALVARRDAVADEHQPAADVVGDDAQPDVGLVVACRR